MCTSTTCGKLTSQCLPLPSFRWKLPSSPSSKDQATPATLTTMRRRRSASPLLRNVPRSLPSFRVKREEGRRKLGGVYGRLVKRELEGESSASCPATQETMAPAAKRWKRGNGWKTGEETDNQQCCLLCCNSIMFYLLLCLIYGTLYNEGVLHNLWVLETPPSLRVVLHFFSPTFSFLRPTSFILFTSSHLGHTILHPAVHNTISWSPPLLRSS